MAKPAKSAAQKRKELIDDQEFVSQKEKEEAKAKVDAKEKTAQAKANKEKDLIGAKDSAKLNKETKTAAKTEDVITLPKREEQKTSSSAADRAKSSSSVKNKTASEAKQTVYESTSKRAGAQSGLDKIETAKREKAAAQAKANKEKDLPGFDGHAAQKAFEQQKAAERIEYLNVKEARDKKSALEQELAEAKAQAKAETEKAGTVQIVSHGIKGKQNDFVLPETQKRIDELEKQISDLNKNINLASRTQEKKYLYNSALKAEDFDEYSKEPEKEEKVINPHQQNIKRETETVKAFMTEDEKAVYNYYYNKFGKEKAEEYFDSIREELNQRQAQAIFSGNEGKVLNEYIQGAAAGLENSKEGYQSFLNMILGIEEPQPISTMDFVSQMAREDLENSGFKLPEALGGASLGQIGFDAINTTANMLPSLMLGTLGGAGIGAAAIGASAAGNAYNSAITEGYSKEQATNYAALVGASEAALGYVLGGIEATGGKLGKAALAKVLPKIDNALAKAAVNVGGKMLSEFSEEYLQEVLSPVFENIALLEENEIDLLSPEAIYSGILGALSAGGIALLDGSANVPEVLQKAEVPVPFNGTAQPGTEAGIVAEKITEIENSSSTESEKAERLERVIEEVAKITGNPEVIAEAEKFKNIHEQNIAEENRKNLSQNADTFEEWILLQDKETIDTHTPKQLQTMFEYDTSVDPEILDYVEFAKENPEKRWSKIDIGEVSDRAANDIKRETGIDTNGYSHYMDVDFVTHVENYHGKNGKSNQSMKNDEDIARIGYILENYDSVKNTGEKSKKYKNKDGSYADKIIYEKAINGTYYIVEAVPDATKKRLNLVTAYISTKKETPNVRKADAKSPGLTSETAPRADGISDNIIHPVAGFDNTSTIGNNVFGAGIFGKGNSESVYGETAADVKTETMERANKDFDVENWKSIAESINPEIGIWRMKDFARVLDSAAGGNKVLRQQLYDLYEKPLNDAQGTYASNYAAKAQSITDKFKELGIKAESKESAAVQRIGEGVKEIDKHGNTVPYTLDDLKKDFPDSWQEIKEGADYCRKVYNDFLRDLNAMYSEIYPATVEQANERVSNYNIRIENDAKYIDRYTEVIETLKNRKAEKQSELSKKRPDSLIYAEIQNQIANIDHKIDVAERRIEQIKNRKLTKEISRDTLKAQIENGEILRNKQIKPRKDYFRHFQELTDEFAEIADIFSNDQRIPPNLAGKSETTKPRTIWTSIAQSRKNGNYYTEDAVSGLLKYTEIAEKLLVFDPLVSHFRDVNSAIRAAGTMVDNEVKGKGNNAGQFASWADDMTNQLAGKTNIIDRIIADKTGAFGRATIKAVEALNHRVKSNAILGNFRSALVQIGNLPNAMLYIQNPADWTMGAVSLTNPTEEIIDARAKSNFMNRRYMGDTIDALTKEIQDNNILDKPKEFALWMLGAGDKAAAELIWHTAYSRAVRNPEVLNSEKGLRNYADAIDYADDITRRSIGGRAEGDIPYFEESKITGLIAPFQIEVANTANALAEQIGKKNVAGIIAFEAGIWLINTVLEGITGDRPLGFDYIEAITDIVKEATGEEEEEEKDVWELVTFGLGRLAGETISGLPFGAQIGRAITGGDEQRAEEWFGDSDPSRYGTGNIGIGALADAADYFVKGETPKELFELATDGEKNSYAEWSEPIKETVDTFAPILMPWGGKQLSRTAGGIDQLIRGGAFGKDSNGNEYLKFPQEYDPESVIKTVLFGQYASDRGQEYIDSNFKSLSAKDTANMELAEEYGLSKQEFYDVILGFREFDKKEEKQEAILQNENLDAREKSVIDWILFGDQKNFPESTRNYSSEEAFYRSGLETGEHRLYEDGYGREEIDAIEKAFSKGDTKVEQIAEIQKALGCTEAEAFEAWERREGKWVDDYSKLTSKEKDRAGGAFDLYGMKPEDYLTVLNYSNFGTVVDGEYSNKMEDVIPKIMEATGWDRKTAEKNYNMVNRFDYSRDDLEDEQKFDLKLSQDWYEVDDKGYFTARNVLKTVEGKKDEYGNTIDGSFKEAAVKEIAKQLNIDEAEATIYYLAANGGLILSADDLTSSHRKDMEAAIEKGWTARSYIDAVNVLKITGSTKKEDILKDLQDAGATYQMAQGYYNLRENKDYDRFVGKVTYKYGMKTEKQETKGDYYLEHFGNGQVTEKDIAKWFAAANGCKKKQEYIDAYMSAGATYQQALDFYQLMQGKNKTFNTWWKENGGE